jgi:hypothetical protein
LGWVSAIDSEGRTIWIVDAHGCGKRFIVRAEEMLTAFLGLESAIRSATPENQPVTEICPPDQIAN